MTEKSWIDAAYEPWEGNGTAMAADIGELPVTVNQWRNRANIPPQYWAKIIEAAARRGHELSVDLFMHGAAGRRGKSESEAA